MKSSKDILQLIPRQLNGIEFPVSKRELIDILRVKGISYEVLRLLSRIPKAAFIDVDDFEQSLFQYNVESENISKSHPITSHFKYSVNKEY